MGGRNQESEIWLDSRLRTTHLRRLAGAMEGKQNRNQRMKKSAACMDFKSQTSGLYNHGNCFQKYTFPLGLFVSWRLFSKIHISPRTFRLMATVFNNSHFPSNFLCHGNCFQLFNNTTPPPPPHPPKHCLMANAFNNTNFPSNFLSHGNFIQQYKFPLRTFVSWQRFSTIHISPRTLHTTHFVQPCTGFERKKRGRALQFLNQLMRALTFPLFIRLRVFLRHSRKSLGSQMKFIF